MIRPMQRRPSLYRRTRVSLCALGVLACGCSPAKFSVGHVMVPVLDNARDAAMASDDLRTFQDGAAANLFLLEGLIETDPGNDALRLNAAMLYFSYAFSTQEATDPGYASILYLKGVSHGRAVLKKNKKFESDFGVPFEAFEKTLPALRKRDVPAAVWTAANWAQFISLHLDSTAVLARHSEGHRTPGACRGARRFLLRRTPLRDDREPARVPAADVRGQPGEVARRTSKRRSRSGAIRSFCRSISTPVTISIASRTATSFGVCCRESSTRRTRRIIRSACST